MVRNDVTAALYGAVLIGNSVLRVISDATAATCHLVLRYIDWLSQQLLPDTAEGEWLDRHGNIWLVNADGSTGRKAATFAEGSATATGQAGFLMPAGTQLSSLGVNYQTTADAYMIGTGPVSVPVLALQAGSIGNLDTGSVLDVSSPIAGIDTSMTVETMTGGTDNETDAELRARILQRIQKPPMGGAEADYVSWALAVPGVTRAWAAPEQGIGTMTVRFMMDDLRASNDGFPLPDDIPAVAAYIDKMRPVTVKDCFVVAPIKQFINITIANLNPNTTECQAEIQSSLEDMLFQTASPGQTIYSAWISTAIMQAPSVVSFDLVTNTDYVMTAPGDMAVLGTILYE
jgi:uncharacterized phage protein gp47/JayE